MVTTRSTSCSPVKKSVASMTSGPASKSMAAAQPVADALRLVIAPKSISQTARFICLPNPSDQTQKRYLFCERIGLLELTQIGTPKHDPRSILFAPATYDNTNPPKQDSVAAGYANKTAEYFTATPFDLCFVLLPIIIKSERSNLFQTADDLLESAFEDALDLKYVFSHGRNMIEEGLSSICDTVGDDDEVMYRYSQNKTVQLLITKAKRVCQNGLPASLEDRFVTRVLEAPILSIKREESSVSVISTGNKAREASNPSDSQSSLENVDSQSSADSAAPSVVFSEISQTTELTTITSTSDTTIPDKVKYLQRLLTAFKFIAVSYTSPSLSSILISALRAPNSGMDFTQLDTYLANLAKLKAEALASTDFTSFSRKRSNFEDDEEAELRLEKKRKLEEEDKRKKANTSHGVKALAKVNTTGMKKMSAFFTSKGPKAKG